jgi:alpha-galactosidase
MSILLRSNLIELNRFLPGGSWRINSLHEHYPSLNSAPISLTWHDSWQHNVWLAQGYPDQVSSLESKRTSFGSFDEATLKWKTECAKLSIRLVFSLASDASIFMWRLVVRNNSQDPVFLDRVTMLHTEKLDDIGEGNFKTSVDVDPIKNRAEGLGFDKERSELAFFSNGWQSWNYAGTLSMENRFPRTRLGPLVLPMRVNVSGPRSSGRGHCTSDMFAVFGDRVSKVGLIVGFVSQQEAFGSVEGWLQPTNPKLRLRAQLDGVQLDPAESFQTDWAFLQYVDLTDKDSLADYFDIAAQVSHARQIKKSLSGWCSWYYAFEDVTQTFIVENLEWATSQKSRMPLDLFQLDDGYEKEVGDWFELKDSFPDGLKALSSEIRNRGLIPGIWLAPCVAKRMSKIGRMHKDWVLRNSMGFPVNPGFIWDSFPYILDITHPEVLDHIRNVVERMAKEMGFEYLKLDFLYTGALPGKKFNQKLTRAQALYKTLKMIRDAAGEDVSLLGCGIPLGSGIGIFDHMRIGPDVAPRWKPAHWGIEGLLDHEMGHPSTRNAILTTINRLPMHQRWWTNDPDCLLIRSTDTVLTEAEVQTLASVIALSGGAMIVSDHLPALTEERVDWLTKLIPTLPHAARAVDWFDTTNPSKLVIELENSLGPWQLICLINWADNEQDLILNLKEFGLENSPAYHVIDFWNQNYKRMTALTLCMPEVPAHGVRMLSVRASSSDPQWLGDSLHISQGLFVKDWKFQEDHLACKLESNRRANGNIWISAPGKLTCAQIGDRDAEFEEIETGVFRLNVEFEGITSLRAAWK